MSDLRLAKFKAGRIDEPWKVRVIEANRQKAINTMNGLLEIVFAGIPAGVGVTDFEAQCNVIAKLSGEEIAAQLRDYWRIVQKELVMAEANGLTDKVTADRSMP